MGDFLHQPSFAAGEISPELYGRVDQGLYYIGFRKGQNFLVMPYGGVANRPGTHFVAEVKDHTKKVRLVPFEFNEEQTYVVELGHEYMRIIMDGGEVLETAKNISAITKANPGVVTATAHGFNNGDQVYIKDIVGMTELNGRTFTVANKATDTFELTDHHGNNIDTTNYTTYSSAGTAARIYTVVTPWEEGDLFDLNYTQSNDVLTVVHNDYYPTDITRSGHASWTVGDFPNEEGPFRDINTSPFFTVSSSLATGYGTTITASNPIFDASMVGELFYMEQPPDDSTPQWIPSKTYTANNVVRADGNYYMCVSNGTSGTVKPSHTEGTATDGSPGVTWQYLHSGFGIVRITAYISGTSVTADIVKRLPDNVVSGGNTHLWAKAAWSEAEGYPAAAVYHKQRFCLGGTKMAPDRLWLSGTALRTFFGKTNPILDDDAISSKLSTSKVNAIRHLLSLSELLALTSASSQAINGPDNLLLATEPLTARPQAYTGASKVIPLVIDNTTLFVKNRGKTVRSLKFSLEEDSFGGEDLCKRSSHLFRKKTIVDWAYQDEPFSIVWVVMSDGALYSFTFVDKERVYAWARHETDGLFESVCCIQEGNEDAVYFVVKREVDGVTKRYVERLASRHFDDVEDAYFVDCGLTYDGRNTTSTTITISGGSTWDNPETLTLTASSSLFKTTDIDDQIVIWYTNASGTEIALRFTISAYSSDTVVSAIPTKIVPASHRNVAITDWRFARSTFAPLYHLEGKEVTVLADGNVIEGLTVEDGQVTIPSPASVVHIGLPYQAHIETLDMAQPQGQTKAKSITIPRVFVTVQETKGLFVSTDGNSLQEYKQRTPEMGYDKAIPAETGVFEIVTTHSWSNRGRIRIEQNLPLPVTINCITPEVVIGYS